MVGQVSFSGLENNTQELKLRNLCLMCGRHVARGMYVSCVYRRVQCVNVKNPTHAETFVAGRGQNKYPHAHSK